MANNPSVIIGSLNDSELKKSIDNLVNHVDSQLNHMVNSTKNATANMQQYLKSIGSTPINFDFNGGGKNNAQILAAIEKIIVANQNLSASSKKTASETTKANNDVTTSFDQMTQAINKSTGKSNKMGILETYDMQIELLKNKLMDVRQNINIFNAAIGTGTKTNIEWGQKGLKEANLEAEKLMRQITAMESKRESLKSIMSPQGDTIKNYVKDLQKANPELALLNQQYKEGNSLLQQQTANARKYTEEVRRQAAEIRKNEDYLAGKTIRVTTPSGHDAAINIKDKLSIEEKLSEAINKQIGQHSNLEQIEAADTAKATERLAVEQKITEEKQKRKYVAPDSWDTEVDSKFLRKFMSERLKVYHAKIVNWDEDKNSVNTLNNALKQLTDTYNKLNSAERNSNIGKTLLSDIQTIERSLQRIRTQAGKPVSLAGIIGIDGRGGLSEKTLDDIAYKIKQLQSYRMGIDLKSDKSASEMKLVDSELNRLKYDMDRYMSSAKKVGEANNALTRSWNYMKNRLAFYFTVGASTNFVKSLIEVRSQYEMNEKALGILINSAERGTKIFQELSNMALVSPYTLIELSTAAKQLSAYDVAAKDVVDTTRRLGDMAAAVGIPIERLTYALGQIKAYGYLNSRDARMFSNAGIPLIKQLSEYYTEVEGKMVSTADVYDRMKKKAIDYNEVMQVMYKMTDEGGKFFDFQAKMAETLKVQLANLTLAWNNMLNDIGQSEGGMLSGGIKMLKEFFLQWKNIERVFYDIITAFGVLKGIQLVYYGVMLGTNKAIAAQVVFGNKLTVVLKTLGSTMSKVLTSGATWWGLLATAAIAAIASVIRGNEQMKEFNESLKEGAKSTYKDLDDFAKKYAEVRKSLYSTKKITLADGSSVFQTKDIDQSEAIKAWDAIREQIELSSKSSETFISRLMTIENVSERVRQGFKILDDVRDVTAAIERLGNDGIKLEKDWSEWWNLWSFADGTIGNLKDAHMWLEKMNKEFGSIDNTKLLAEVDELDNGLKNVFQDKAKVYIENYEAELEKFRKDLKATTESTKNFINNMGFSNDVNKIEETFSRVIDNLALKNNLSAKEAMTLRLSAAEEEYSMIEKALKNHIEDEDAALKHARDKRQKEEIKSRLLVYKQDLEFLQNNSAESRVYWEDFTKWMGERHRSEIQSMFGNMNAQQIKALDWSKGKYYEWVKDLAEKYAKENGMAFEEVFDMLRNYVKDANQMSIRIPLLIDYEQKKSEIDILKQADLDLKDATEKYDRLKKRASQLKSQGAVDLGFASAPSKEDYSGSVLGMTAWGSAVKQTSEQVEEGSDKNKEYTQTLREMEQAQKDAKDARERGGLQKDKKGNKKDVLGETLKQQIQLINEMRSSYDKLRKAGVNNTEAIATASKGYEASISRINTILGKFGVPKFNASDFAGKDYRELLKALQNQRNILSKNGKVSTSSLEALDIEIKKLVVDAKTYDFNKITEGLNRKLSDLNESYELAIELDADPELGTAFAKMIGLNIDSLPRTVEEYGKRYANLLNEYFKEKKIGLVLPDVQFTNYNMEAFKKMKDEGQLTEEAYKLIEDAVKSYREKVKKENSDTIKDWNALIDKFGKLQDKLMKISKEAAVDQYNIVKKFGDADDKKNAINLLDSIKVSDDPEEIERLSADFQKIVSKIAEKNPAALKVYIASQNEEKEKSGKAYWDDFKNSDLYSMTFEDMANVSTAAIRKIIDQLEALKGKVKEDPASMKALMKSLKDAEKELRNRNPFYATVKGLKEYIEAAKKAKTAQDAYNKAVKNREKAQQDYDNTEDATPEEREKAYTKLKQAVEAETNAEKDNIDSQNDAEKKRKNFGAALQKTGSDIQNIGQIVGEVGNIFQTLFGNPNEYDETAEIINDVAASLEGLGKAATGVGQIASGDIIGGVSNLISGVWDTVSTWLDNSDKKISAETKDSELAVKRLETAYRSLEREIEKAYGMATIGAKKAAKANKELQLAELKRQLALEQSRSKKKRDNNRIEELKGQIIELEHSIKDTTEDIVNDLLGISSVGDAAEDFMKNFVDALRSGENAMKGFKESINDMIANMLVKMLTTKIIAPYIESIFNDIEKSIEDRGNSLARQVETAKGKLDRGNAVDLNNNNSIIDALRALGFTEDEIHRLVWYDESGAWDEHQSGTNQRLRDAWQQAIAAAEKNYNDKSKQLEDATSYNLEDIKEVGDKWRELEPVMSERVEEIQAMINELGLMKPYKLSALQQGIQGVTEDTAGAIEAYMNILNQHVFKQEASVTEIKDMLAQFNPNVQLGLMSQMLLQLQQSYQMQQSIKSILEGWSSNDGMSVKVELRS